MISLLLEIFIRRMQLIKTMDALTRERLRRDIRAIYGYKLKLHLSSWMG